MSFERWLVAKISANNLITKTQLNKALQLQNEEGKTLLDILVEYAYFTEKEADRLKQQFSTTLNPDSPTKAQATTIIPKHKAQATAIINNKTQHNSEATAIISNRETKISQKNSNNAKISGQFGNYSVLNLLGEGSFGRVYLAVDPQTQQKIALKIFAPEDSGDGKHLERFQRETKAISQLNHPNIISVYDVGTIDGRVYYTMKYINGKPLEDILKDNNKIPGGEAARIVLQVARALDYAHTNNIIHRDIKPGNVLIDENGTACVMDFGLAKEISGGERVTQTGFILGTPAYMSPEQASGRNKTLDGRSDIYSLGSTFYHMLTGEHVFTGPNSITIIQQIIAQLPTPPTSIEPDIPEKLEDICLKSLQKDKNKRYQTAGQMADELEAFIAGKNTKKSRFWISNPFKKS